MSIILRLKWEGLVTLMIALLLASCTVPKIPEGPYVKYSLEGRSIRIVTAVTPFDSNEKARKAFLHWFVRGLDTVLLGKQALHVEWQQSPEGQAGRQGYDIGMQEAETYLKDGKAPGQQLRVTRILQLEI